MSQIGGQYRHVSLDVRPNSIPLHNCFYGEGVSEIMDSRTVVIGRFPETDSA